MAAQPSDYFDVVDRDPVTIVRLIVPEIRHPTPAQEFGADVRALVEQEGRKDILIDLGAVHYMSSTGFATLVTLAKNIHAAGGRMKISNIQPDVAVGANIIGLGQLVETYPDEASALKAF